MAELTTRTPVVVLLTSTALLVSAHAFAEPWPRLSDGHDLVPCVDALTLATEVYRSNSAGVSYPPVDGRGLRSKFVLKPKVRSGGTFDGGLELNADPAHFETLAPPSEARDRLYWGTTAANGYRLVVHGNLIGWRGYNYSAFSIAESSTPESFLADLNKNRPSLIDAAAWGDPWSVPLVLRERESGRYWILETGRDYPVLSDWLVRVADAKGMVLRCRVLFRPDLEGAVSLLPEPVQELARLLDETLGPAGYREVEGTLQQTGRLRGFVQAIWANAALRPWSLHEPYNTREEVDEGLEVWSHQGAAYLDQYNRIKRQYQAAEQSLADYYRGAYDLNASEATAFSAYAIDIALRAHYMFPSEDPNSYFRNKNAPPNPWPRQ